MSQLRDTVIGYELVSGCPIVIKPSLKSPISAYLVGTMSPNWASCGRYKRGLW
ncbi:MAG: hypothetical protein ACWIPH_01630 [Ostreibacterium sp.]